MPDCTEYGNWQIQMQVRTEQRYLAALSGLVDAHWAAGELNTAVDYALRYLAVDDLAEDMHRRLIELHAARKDRNAVAHQFEQCALILERELGVRPLPETRAAYETAIATQPVQRPAQPHWSVLPSLNLPLVGREGAWQALTKNYARLRSGGLILISGEPGVGKSRLMREFAMAGDAFVLAGNNSVGAETIPYTAIVAALRQALSSPQRWRSIPPIWLAETARLLPEIGELFPDLPAPVALEQISAQTRLSDALSRCLRALADDGPVLLCLDDLQRADPATLSWLAGLPWQIADSRVCLLATCRIANDDRLAAVRRAFARPGLLTETSLACLSLEAVAKMLAHLPQHPPDPLRLAARLHHATGGNPFFMLETVRALLEGDRLAAPPEQLPLAPTVQAAIRRRLDRLSPLGRQILETAAVLAPDLAFDLVQAAAGRSDMETAQGVDETSRRQLLVPGDPLHFNHDLVRQVVYDAISPWRRRILHRRAAEALDTIFMSRREPVWASMARHYEWAGDTGQAIRCLEQAALTAGRFYAHQEVIEYLERALELERNIFSQNETIARLQELLGDSLMARGRHAQAEEAFSVALALIPVAEPSRQAGLYKKLSASFQARYLSSEAEAASGRALAALGPPADDWPWTWRHVWLELQLSRMDILYFQADLDRLAQLIAEIEPIVTTTDSPAYRADFAVGLMDLAIRQEHFTLSAETVAAAEAVLAATQETDDPARLAWGWFGLGFSLLWAGRTTEAATPLLTGLQQAREYGLAYTEVLCLTYLACLFRFARDETEAQRFAEESLIACRAVDMPVYRATSHANLAALRQRHGQVEAAQAEAERALDLWGDYPYPFRWLAHWVLLAVYTERADLAAAMAQAQAILHPSQRRQPGEVPQALTFAVSAWQNDPGEAEVALQRAIMLAELEGYL